MAQLIRHNGKYYKGSPGQWQEIGANQYAEEMMSQNQIQGQPALIRGWAGYSNYVKNTLSGLRELTYGDPAEEQRFRAEQAEAYQPYADYGGFAPSAGQFTGAASTAVLPGGLKTQMAIGGVQGAAESPERPILGAGFGAALTWAGDWAAEGIGRITRTLTLKRAAIDPDYAATLQRGIDEGLEFTPAEMADDPAARMMEKQMMKNPRYAQLDLDRFLSNQSQLNSAAARMIDAPATGRITPPMRGKAVEEVGKAFDDIAENSAPIELMGKDFLDLYQSGNVSGTGRELISDFVDKFPKLFEGQPFSGREFVRARNWLGAQSRLPVNWKSGVAEELQPFLRIMDDSLERANEIANPMLVSNIRRARQKWKSLMVIEDSLRGAEQAAKGNLTAATAYNVLKKYDKGGIFRGRSRDPFSNIVDAMAAAGDAPPTVMPSTDIGQGGPLRAMMDTFWNAPAAERYMRGQNIGRVMLGQLEPAGTITRGMQTGAIGTARGLMAQDEDRLP